MQIGIIGTLVLLILVGFVLFLIYADYTITFGNVLVSILIIGSPVFLVVSDLIDYKKLDQVKIKVKSEPNVKITPSQFVRGASFNFEFSDKAIEIGFSSGKKFKELWAALNELEKTS